MSSLKLFLFVLLFSYSSAANSFLKGLLVGALLGHKKADLHHHEEPKEYHHMEPVVEKEYVPVPVHQEPQYIPVYIVKECPKKDKQINHVVLHQFPQTDTYSADIPVDIMAAKYPMANKYKFASDFPETDFGEYSSASVKKYRLKSGSNDSENNGIGLVLSVAKEQ